MLLPILKLPTTSLRERSISVSKEQLQDAELQAFFDAMIPTMYDDDGIGLAAPQVGRNIRVCVVGKEALRQGLVDKHHHINKKEDLVLVNPIWEPTSKKMEVDTEGCLSVPTLYGTVKRYKHIHVTALDRHGNTLAFEAKNYFARVIQHEVDHLDGVLFIDRAIETYPIRG